MPGRPRRQGLLAALLVIAPVGCFADPPSLGGGSTDGDGSTASESGPGSAPTTGDESSPTEPDGSGGSESVPVGCGDGTIEGDEICDDGNEDPGDGCEPDCRPSPGFPHWQVIEPGFDLDASAQAMLVDDDGDVFVCGLVDVGKDGSDPWVARHGTDGAQRWSVDDGTGGGRDHCRGLAFDGTGRVVAGGASTPKSGLESAWLGLFTADSRQGWSATAMLAGENSRHTAVAIDATGGLYAVGVFGPDEATLQPLVVSYQPNMGGAWDPAWSSYDTSVLADYQGQLFGMALTDGGELLAVGSAEQGEGAVPLVLRLSTDGDLLDELVLTGMGVGDFADIVIDDGDVWVAGRLQEVAGQSEIVVARLSATATAVQWMGTWSGKAVNYANAMAVHQGGLFVVGSTGDTGNAVDLDAFILRWDGENETPTWVASFADDAPGLDFAADVAGSPDGTVVVVGGVTQPGETHLDAWLRKIEP